jgi:hypothetical protein
MPYKCPLRKTLATQNPAPVCMLQEYYVAVLIPTDALKKRACHKVCTAAWKVRCIYLISREEQTGSYNLTGLVWGSGQS